MKAKKFPKKLTFNKQTIARLSNFEIKDVLGGYTPWPKPETVPLSVCEGYTCDETTVYCCPG